MTSRRYLNKKKLRYALWVAAGGRCMQCGVLLPLNWHADHIVPYRISGVTNVHQMQALCPTCNWAKGGKLLMGLRQHQAQIDAICQEVISRKANGLAPIKYVLSHVTPGGGKSLLPIIVTERLCKILGARISWIVPRHTLRIQGEANYTDGDLRKIFPHTNKIRASGNDYDPDRDFQGYITTYQAVQEHPQLHLDAFKAWPRILFIDEFHHAEENSMYAQAIKPLVDEAVLTVLMSGTIERGDRKPIAFLEYTKEGKVNTHPADDWRYVHYSRSDAVRDRAIVKLEFCLIDGRTEIEDANNGTVYAYDAFKDVFKDHEGASVYSAVTSEIGSNILRTGVADWQRYKEQNYPNAKCLVVTAGIDEARKYHRMLKADGIEARIAVSADSKIGIDNIERFKVARSDGGDVDVLVTVAMAYEGLDVKHITHVIVVTHYRSEPWIEQCVSRANRVAEGKDRGFIYAPADRQFQAIVARIKEEQELGLLARKEGPGGGGHQQGIFIPRGSKPTDETWLGIDGQSPLSSDDVVRLREYQARFHVVGSLLDLRDLINCARSDNAERPSDFKKSPPKPGVTDEPPSVTESSLRKVLNDLVREVGKIRAQQSGSALTSELIGSYIRGENTNLQYRFDGRNRASLTISELHSAIDYMIKRRDELAGEPR